MLQQFVEAIWTAPASTWIDAAKVVGIVLAVVFGILAIGNVVDEFNAERRGKRTKGGN